MKKIFHFLFLFPILVLSQQELERYDYFVQFNTPGFTKKVNMDSLFNHKIFKSASEANSNFNSNDFIAFIDKTSPVTIHGNFTDSIPYYQMTFQMKDIKGWRVFIQNQVNNKNAVATDSIQEVITKYSNYSVYSPKSDDFSIAWNDNNLIVYGIWDTNKNIAYNAYADTSVVVDETMIEEGEYYEDEYYEDPSVEVYEESPVTEMETNQTVYDEEAIVQDQAYEDEEYKEWLATFEKEKVQERIQKHKKQEEQIAILFQNGFVLPTSSKINKQADIASWINYEAVYGKMSSFYNLLGSIPHNKEANYSKNAIKGMNLDFYFENNKARIEQKVEYSESLARIMQKIVTRKPNKNIYNYFPKQDPLAYLTYHASTEELLKNYPEIMEQLLGNLPMDKEDTAIIIDLISTVVDEEATASLFDGDFSMFLHAMETYESTFMSRTYDENYEEVEEEKTITKTRPIFTFIMTSTHPTMGEKLLDLGIRKNLLQKVDGYYLVKQSDDLGELIIIKKGDVFVFTNGLHFLNSGSKSNFTKKIKKNLVKNYFYGNFEVQRFFRSYLLDQNLGSDTARMIRLGDQFKNIEMKSSKKIKDNVMMLEMSINSNFSDKNIILQTLDLVDFLD